MTATGAAASPAFSRGGALALAGGGLALLLALLYLISAGAEFGGGERGGGQAHAAANGLNGYAGLVRLTEAQGYTVTRSRSGAGLKTDGLLVLTPPLAADPEAIGKLLAERRFTGPTLLIVPKWTALPPPPDLPSTERAKFKRGWVRLAGAEPSGWPEALPAPYAFTLALDGTEAGAVPTRWSGMGRTGALPTAAVLHAKIGAGQRTLVTDARARTLAFAIAAEGGNPDEEPFPVAVIAEPDLSNNYGLDDPARAAATIAIIDALTDDGEIGAVTFDMTLNGFGASENLLTLAFRPPFLAATLSLLVALLIVGWRAFQRFGPPAAAAGPDIAFGKRQLIVNGAGLILRARRFRLLGAPYAAIAARRIAERLGVPRAEPEAIDAALARRLPDEEPFTRRAARLEAADKPAAILAAARSLDDLAAKLQQGPTTR
ncbi:DUF4350 domain-containing protein [Erythrobacter sp. WG]|uniref:DUF4350 domain-containing protein n=1 Tax=Erythrobacter sp. WG TaxID=2985510 RepID=UPI00226E9934|nr:DUF4350 domain-containing protein [Erythrobacter sp. WG]MCX9146010.1 DUF4350 domain-containing protein [Erythrobacter sp. WG]